MRVPHLPRRSVSRRYVGLDQQIVRPANHHQVLGVVAADQDEASPLVDDGGVDHSKVPPASRRNRGAAVDGKPVN
jgi:hypothetical protein